MDKSTLKFTFSCAKWANADEAIKDYCFLKSLDCEIDCKKGLFRANHRVKIVGSTEELDSFSKSFNKAIEEYNN